MIDATSFPLLTLLVPDNEENCRLDMFLSKQFQDISREKIKTEIKKGSVSIDEVVCTKPKYLLRAGQSITASFTFPTTTLAPEEGTIDVIYKDSSLVVIDKPFGITVHPCPSCPKGTLANRLVASFPELYKQEGFRPGIVHRLDKDTSGLMLVALEEKSRLALSKQFANHTIYKEYLALVYGELKQKEGTIEAALGRDPKSKTKMAVVKTGKYAKSSWRTLYTDTNKQFSVVAIRIFTGRTHQIRVHMAYMGHPLIGDTVYGPSSKNYNDSELKTTQDNYSPLPKSHKGEKIQKIAPINCNRQMLHAWHLSFEHPYPDCINAPLTGENTISPNKTAKMENKKESCNQAKMPMVKGKTSHVRSIAKYTTLYQKEQRILSFTCQPPSDFVTTLESLVNRPLQVIITGMPGCGKSTVLKELQLLDVPVFSADDVVAKLYAKDGDGTYLLKARYGDSFLAEDGALDKKKLGKAMQESSTLRREVEAMIHPLVYHASEQFFSQHNEKETLLAVAEVPLFFESGEKTSKDLDFFVVGVNCPYPIRARRLAKTRGWTEEMITTVESWQLSEDKKMLACDTIIDNTKDKVALKAHVKKLYDELLTIRKVKNTAIISSIEECWQKVVFP